MNLKFAVATAVALSSEEYNIIVDICDEDRLDDRQRIFFCYIL